MLLARWIGGGSRNEREFSFVARARAREGSASGAGADKSREVNLDELMSLAEDDWDNDEEDFEGSFMEEPDEDEELEAQDDTVCRASCSF